MLVFYLQLPDSNRHTATEDNIKSVKKPRIPTLPRIDSDDESISQSESESLTTRRNSASLGVKSPEEVKASESESLTTRRNSASLGVKSPEEEKAAGGTKRKTMQQPINNLRAEAEVPVKRVHINNRAEAEVPVKKAHNRHQASSMYISTNNGISAVMKSVLWMMLIMIIVIIVMRVNNALFIVRLLYTY